MLHQLTNFHDINGSRPPRQPVTLSSAGFGSARVDGPPGFACVVAVESGAPCWLAPHRNDGTRGDPTWLKPGDRAPITEAVQIWTEGPETSQVRFWTPDQPEFKEAA